MPANTLTDNPQAAHTLAADQPNIQANNLYFANTLNKDHQIGPANGTRNDGISNEGYHTVIHLVNQGADPAPVSSSEIYTKTVGSNSELFYRYGSAPNNIFQVTNNGATAGTSGFTSIVSPAATPMKMLWGTVPGNTSSGSVTVSGITTIYNIQMCAITDGTTPSGNATFAVKSVAANAFNWVRITASGNYNGFYWLVIGS